MVQWNPASGETADKKENRVFETRKAAKRPVRLLLGFAGVTGLLIDGSPAGAAAAVVVITTSASPQYVRVRQNESVEWQFKVATTCQSWPLGLNYLRFGSDQPEGTATHLFTGAGKFSYLCENDVGGLITVPMRARPLKGDTSTPFEVIWATSVPQGYAYNVYYSQPGTPDHWKPLAVAATNPSTTFMPDAGPGTYLFRAQMRNMATAKRAGYSPAKPITVDP